LFLDAGRNHNVFHLGSINNYSSEKRKMMRRRKVEHTNTAVFFPSFHIPNNGRQPSGFCRNRDGEALAKWTETILMKPSAEGNGEGLKNMRRGGQMFFVSFLSFAIFTAPYTHSAVC
jgi:hypothetical protein